jgi:hypothetical protein
MKFSPPRRPGYVDYAVVYRRETEFCSWPSNLSAQGEGLR